MQPEGPFGIRMGVRHLPVQKILQAGQQRLQTIHAVGKEQPPDPEHLELRIVDDKILWQSINPVQHGEVISAMDQVVAVLGEHPGKPGPVLLSDDLGNGFLHVAMGQ